MAIKPMVNESGLLAKIANGDERAFTELFTWYAGPLGTFVNKLTDDPMVTQEIVQDAFVKVWLRRGTLTNIENFSGYLYILCRNHTYAALKKLALERTYQAGVEQHLLDESLLAELDNPGEKYRALIEQAVAKLPAQQQKAYTMSRYDRLKHEEIARELQISSETVKKHIQLAVQFIREDVGNHADLGIILILTTPFIFC